MPEPAKRVAILGTKRAEKTFQRTIRERVTAERTVPRVTRELQELDRRAEELAREADGGP
jgi:hypothetical protein